MLYYHVHALQIKINKRKNLEAAEYTWERGHYYSKFAPLGSLPLDVRYSRGTADQIFINFKGFLSATFGLQDAI